MKSNSAGHTSQNGKRTLLVGSAVTLRQMQHILVAASIQPHVVGCLAIAADDACTSDLILPCPNLGMEVELLKICSDHEIEQVLVSLPVAQRHRIVELTAKLDSAGVDWRVLPALEDQLAGRIPALKPDSQEVDLARLINRPAKSLDEHAIRRTITGRVVMITGGGGSIGSELSRIVARFDPARLVIVERSENALFEVDQQIRRLFPDLPRAAVLHDVADASRTMAMVMAQKPDVIFHAAAHKHVPMMEDHPSQAVENNFYGTRSIADAAAACGVDRFVMISTDKAVNPSSIMGATKRLAELYICHLNNRSDTTFSMVRFGNVLGSACSVLPIWQQQLSHGGPITVTHPDMTRYFMTIPEAAGLVIQSAALSNHDGRGGGEVFLLDMGEPIRILELAQRFVRSQGLEPNIDIQIEITGIRPGEKLFEELAYDGEDMIPTPHEAIRIWRTTPPDSAVMQQVCQTFDRLREARSPGEHRWQHASHDAIYNALCRAIPEMLPRTKTHAVAG